MGGHAYGLIFRKGWFTRGLLKSAALFIAADAYVKYEYGIDVNYDFNTSAWKWWMDKTPEERYVPVCVVVCECTFGMVGRWISIDKCPLIAGLEACVPPWVLRQFGRLGVNVRQLAL